MKSPRIRSFRILASRTTNGLKDHCRRVWCHASIRLHVAAVSCWPRAERERCSVRKYGKSRLSNGAILGQCVCTCARSNVRSQTRRATRVRRFSQSRPSISAREADAFGRDKAGNDNSAMSWFSVRVGCFIDTCTHILVTSTYIMSGLISFVPSVKRASL